MEHAEKTPYSKAPWGGKLEKHPNFFPRKGGKRLLNSLARGRKSQINRAFFPGKSQIFPGGP